MGDDSTKTISRFELWWDDTKGVIARVLGIEVSRDTTEDFALAITPEVENLREALLHATELLRLSGKYVDWEAVHEQWDIEGRIPMPVEQAHTNILEAASSDLDLASKADTRSCVFCLSINRVQYPPRHFNTPLSDGASTSINRVQFQQLVCRTIMSDSRYKGRVLWERGFHIVDHEKAFYFHCGDISESLRIWD